MNRNKRLAEITKEVKRDWIPNMVDAMIIDLEVFSAKLDNSETDLELMQRGLI